MLTLEKYKSIINTSAVEELNFICVKYNEQITNKLFTKLKLLMGGTVIQDFIYLPKLWVL